MNLRNPVFLPRINTESGGRSILFRASKIINENHIAISNLECDKQ